jgi:hypothetical protein
VRDWYRGLRQAGPRVGQAANAAGRQAQVMASDYDAAHPSRPNTLAS